MSGRFTVFDKWLEEMEMLGAESAAKTFGPDAYSFATEKLRISAGSNPETSNIRRFFLLQAASATTMLARINQLTSPEYFSSILIFLIIPPARHQNAKN